MPPPPPATFAPSLPAGYQGYTSAEMGQLAGFWIRFASWLLDSILYGLVAAVFLVPAIAIGINAFDGCTWIDNDFGDSQELLCPPGTPEAGPVAAAIALALAGILIVLIIYVRGLGRGQTWGMKLTSIRLVRADNGLPVGFGKALGRTLFANIVSANVFYLGYLWAAVGRPQADLAGQDRQVVRRPRLNVQAGAHMDLTTVADDLVVLHDGTTVHRFDGLAPSTEHRFLDVPVRTLDRPPGELLCRFATVNDVHFGEIEAGRIDDLTDGPIRRAAPDADPYPEVMNHAAAAEMGAIDPAAVIVKGDLSAEGTESQWAEFEDCYRTAFGERLYVVRGNHDAYEHQDAYAGDQWIDLDGVAVALLDTAIPGATTGRLTTEQIEWLDDRLTRADRPVLVMGHHQQWIAGAGGSRSDDYFGLHPDASDALDEVCARHTTVLAYAAGHTHRHRSRRMTRSGAVSIEVGCTKDFPGTWAEYRVFEGGVMQVVHRMSSTAALEWSESCRHLYADFGVDYESYALGSLDDRCFVIPSR